MVLPIRKATKRTAKIRLAMQGPSGSGKTYSALAIASGLGKRVGVVDTERGSASLYADIFDFEVIELFDSHSTDLYIDAIRTLEAHGCDVIIIDSLSHAWMGKDGALEQVDSAAKRSKSGNSFAAWREVTPKHNALVDAILQCKAHVIATMRAKTEWDTTPDPKTGKMSPRRIGLAAVQRDGIEYEFTIVGDITVEHEMIISKTRMSTLADKVVAKPGKALGTEILEWINAGVAPATPTPPAAASTPSAPSTTADVKQSATAERDALKKELEDIAKQIGGRPELEKRLGYWPKTLLAARSAITVARSIRDEIAANDMPMDDDDPGDSPGPTATAPPTLMVVPKADEAQQPGPSANQAPEAAQTEPANGVAEASSPSTKEEAGQTFVSVPAFWRKVTEAHISDLDLAADIKDLFGLNNPGHLTPQQRTEYVAQISARASEVRS